MELYNCCLCCRFVWQQRCVCLLYFYIGAWRAGSAYTSPSSTQNSALTQTPSPAGNSTSALPTETSETTFQESFLGSLIGAVLMAGALWLQAGFWCILRNANDVVANEGNRRATPYSPFAGSFMHGPIRSVTGWTTNNHRSGRIPHNSTSRKQCR